jgi:transketolase
LYDDVLRYDATRPHWPERDRFVLSKGHGCLALYALLADKRFFPEAELSKFCKSDGLLGGHPEHHIPGVEASTGSLGHGMSSALGFALSARLARASHRTFVVIGDGESNEGSVWEAALSAGKPPEPVHGAHRLQQASVVPARASCRISSRSATNGGRSASAVRDVNGHDVNELRDVLTKLPLDANKPTAIICHTVKGKGVAYAENNMAWHHQNKVSAADAEKLIEALEAVR